MEKSDTQGGTNVRVVARLRPALNREISDGKLRDEYIRIHTDEEKGFISFTTDYESTTYVYDAAYDEKMSTEQIFDREVLPLLERVRSGQEATILCYGATGAGKTFTVQGKKSQNGIMQLIVQFLLSKLKGENDGISFSMLQDHKDDLRDLVANQKVKIYQKKNGSVQVQQVDERGRPKRDSPLSLVPVSSLDQFQNKYNTAIKRRKWGKTDLNKVSSRSHVITQIYIKQQIDEKEIRGSLKVVDLAGSESNKLTNNTGDRLKESQHINSTLMFLHRMIDSAIKNRNADNKTGGRHGGNIERLLKDSFGGNSVCLLLVHLSPNFTQHTSTKATLDYGKKSKLIKNHPKKNIKDVPREQKLAAFLKTKNKRKSNAPSINPSKKLKIKTSRRNTYASSSSSSSSSNSFKKQPKTRRGTLEPTTPTSSSSSGAHQQKASSVRLTPIKKKLDKVLKKNEVLEHRIEELQKIASQRTVNEKNEGDIKTIKDPAARSRSASSSSSSASSKVKMPSSDDELGTMMEKQFDKWFSKKADQMKHTTSSKRKYSAANDDKDRENQPVKTQKCDRDILERKAIRAFNTWNEKELLEIHGVGAAKAEYVVDYRENEGKGKALGKNLVKYSLRIKSDQVWDRLLNNNIELFSGVDV